MPQTLLAFLAMMIAALSAINQYTAQLQSYEAAYRSEFELMANAVVLEEIEIIDLTTSYGGLESLNGSELKRSFEIGADGIEFDLTVTVTFVDEFGTPSATATTQKELSIAAIHPRFATPLVTHTRIIAQ
jgi:hypothetical protein